MTKEYKLTSNLFLTINYRKYIPEVINATVNYLKKGMYKGEEEDESDTGGYWDLANTIVSREIGWLEDMIYKGEAPIEPQDIDELIDVVYDDVKRFAAQLMKEVILKGVSYPTTKTGGFLLHSAISS